MGARATVIIPTFGEASFARWAVKSVQSQTVRDIEICVVCDGSPEHMINFFKDMSREDSRITVYSYPKSPRTGEPYRDTVIKKTTGKIICYCAHDDLWLPNHVQEMEASLNTSSFTHSLHVNVNLPEEVEGKGSLFSLISFINIRKSYAQRKMMRGKNFFGLTYGAHTRDSYLKLKEGWVTTPKKDVATDLYMWCKYLAAFPDECQTVMKITALKFPFDFRKNWSQQQRDDELQYYFNRIQDPNFRNTISKYYLIFKVKYIGKRLKKRIRKRIRRLIYL